MYLFFIILLFHFNASWILGNNYLFSAKEYTTVTAYLVQHFEAVAVL